MNDLMLCVVIVALIVNAMIASKFSNIANKKGQAGYFWWCFLFGIIGWLMVIALPDRKKEDKIKNFMKD